MRHALVILSSALLGACGPSGPGAEEPTENEPRADATEGQCGHGGMGNGMRGGMAQCGMAHGGMGNGMHGGMGNGMHGGMGNGMHGGMGNGRRAPAPEHRDDFHALLDAHEGIERHVELTDEGAITRTTSDDPRTTTVLRRHVSAMKDHLAAGGRVRQWDPLFAALADHADAIEMTIDEVPGGVSVVTRGHTPEAIALIHAHAGVVSAFVAHGREEAHREHPAPDTR